MLHQFHLIKGNNNLNIAFHIDSNTIIEINDFVFDVLNLLQKGETVENVSIIKKIDNKSLNMFIKKIYNSVNAKNNKSAEKTKPIKSIGRITLHVANNCNLSCKYCYAKGGSYETETKLMDKKTAIDIVEFFTERFESIEHIVFFGGEPLLNPQIIKLICEHIKTIYCKGKLVNMPKFGIITNGTILNNKILEIINEYIDFITVSIDGWKEINDFNRIYPDGSGSYNKISSFIKKIKEKTNVTVQYEATLTTEHKKNNITDNLVSNFMLKEFGIEGTIVPDIYIDLDSNRENTNYDSSLNVFNLELDKIYLHDGFSHVLGAIVHNLSREMCPVGQNIVSVSVNGEIYPCHMNTGKEHLSLGSIYSENIFNNSNYYFNHHPYLNSIKKEDKPCLFCWIKRICGGCVMRWFYDYKKDNFSILPFSVLCEKNKKYVESIILELAKIKKDKIKWEKFTNLIKSSSQVKCE